MRIKKGFKIISMSWLKGLVGQFDPPTIGLRVKSSGSLIYMYSLFC